MIDCELSDAAECVDCWLQTFDDNNEITQTMSSSVTASYVTIDSDDLDRELDSLLDVHPSVGYRYHLMKTRQSRCALT